MQSTNEMAETIETILNQLIFFITDYGMRVVGALLVLIIGLWLAGRMRALVASGLRRSGRVDETLVTFFASMVKYAVIAFTVIAVLGQFGVETTSLIAVVGAAGLAIGLALQGTLSNVAAGVMLLIFRPFKVGDFVEAAGQAATIKELNLFFTVMATGDNVHIAVPNGAIWGGTIKNFSTNATRRVDFVFGVAYDANLDTAMDVIKSTITADGRVHSDPAPMVAVSELADSSVNIIARVWVDAGDYWGVKFDATKAVKGALDDKGIAIPFPSRTVYSVQG